jgi:hypothetical protein
VEQAENLQVITIFLFSGGFFLSGYSNGTLFANAVASASNS